jgi:N-acetylmuramoyl-L-alanine amidase
LREASALATAWRRLLQMIGLPFVAEIAPKYSKAPGREPTEPFGADSVLVAQVLPSPNYGERAEGRTPDMILLHYTGMPDAEGALERLCSAGSEVSAHYVVLEDGTVIQCVRETLRAWHAGLSSWAGETDINSRAIGIEIVNPGHDGGYPAFPSRQIAAVTALCRGIIHRHRIPARRVLGHSDVAPSRKNDPGEKFPWASLAASGVGLWAHPVAATGAALQYGAQGEAVGALQEKLARFGYGIAVNSDYDSMMVDVVTAFQRHFRPHKIDGVADAPTRATLDALLELI